MNPWIAKAVVLAATMVMLAIRAPHGRDSRRVKVAKSYWNQLEAGLLVLVWVGFFIPFIWIASPLFAFAEYPLRMGPLFAGMACFVIGLWLFYRSHADLGTNWSITLEVREQHRLVTQGIYRRIRHPMYTALVLYGLAHALVIPNWIAGPSNLVPFVILFLLRVGTEERMMIEQFGDEYSAYMSRTKRLVPGIWSIALLAFLMDNAHLGAAGSCEALASLNLPNISTTSARVVDASCQVTATLRPSSDSDIKVELWMPAANWNGKFMAVGNGAFNGTINQQAMAAALKRGYAAASTDTGHVGGSASFALGHPEKVIDFGWRAVHEMTVASKQIIAAYYAGGPRLSYWNGCSAGGRQGMKEAQRFPADFDGIIAGAPGLDWTGRAAKAVSVAQALMNDPGARLSPANAQHLHAAVLEACDARDGVADGVLNDPRSCTFDPAALQCKGTNDGSCLTPAQVNTARSMYSALVNPKTKREVTGVQRGSEFGWTDLGWSASARATGLDQFRFLVFKEPAWTIDRFNFVTDIVRAEDSDNDMLNALDPDLAAFFKRGGKLIQYHGWNDPQISPGNSVQYYERVASTLGGLDKIQASHRLFMAPGTAHCGGGEGPSAFEVVEPLEQWVEQGKAPDRIVASRFINGVADRTRPLCPFPQVATYQGSGSTDAAASFVCSTPR
jgi:protein-S-isoprenylcysteine O-methyltransferase Ste14